MESKCDAIDVEELLDLIDLVGPVLDGLLDELEQHESDVIEDTRFITLHDTVKKLLSLGRTVSCTLPTSHSSHSS